MRIFAILAFPWEGWLASPKYKGLIREIALPKQVRISKAQNDPPEAAATQNPQLGEPQNRKSRQKILKDVIFQKYDPPEAAATWNPLLESQSHKQRFFHERALEKWWGAVKHGFLFGISLRVFLISSKSGMAKKSSCWKIRTATGFLSKTTKSCLKWSQTA